MAINLKKSTFVNYDDYQKLIEINKRTKRARRHRRFLLAAMITMIVMGFAILFIGFAILPPTKTNFALITALQFTAFLGAFCYYECYLIEKGGRQS